MTLDPKIRHILDVRAADVAKDIDHTNACLANVRAEMVRTRATLAELRQEENAIIEARKLLMRASLEQEATT